MEIYLSRSFKFLKQNLTIIRKAHVSSKSSASPNASRIGVNGIALLTIPIGTFCLGCWQVSRRKWKLNLIKNLESKTRESPIPFPSNLDELNDLEYRKIIIQGKFDHDKELYLGPRPKIVGGDISDFGGGMISSGESGYNVITPITLSNSNLKILVNRGWVPRNYLNPEKRKEGQVSESVQLTAVVRKHESRAPFMPENSSNSKIFSYKDVIKMSEITGSLPVYVEAVETINGGPLGGQTRVSLRNEHMSYLLTWYSLSLATSFLWFRKFILNKPLM